MQERTERRGLAGAGGTTHHDQAGARLQHAVNRRLLVGVVAQAVDRPDLGVATRAKDAQGDIETGGVGGHVGKAKFQIHPLAADDDILGDLRVLELLRIEVHARHLGVDENMPCQRLAFEHRKVPDHLEVAVHAHQDASASRPDFEVNIRGLRGDGRAQQFLKQGAELVFTHIPARVRLHRSHGNVVVHDFEDFRRRRATGVRRFFCVQ